MNCLSNGVIEEKEAGIVASAASHVAPDGACETMPGSQAGFVKVLRAMPPQSCLNKYITFQ